jgi:uncharacterized protein YhjY with autotransporter beta-barrel domain
MEPGLALCNPVFAFAIGIRLLRTGIQRFVWVLAIAVAFAAASGRDAEAANTGCTDGDCTDVPTDGIRYLNSVDTVNVGDGVPGEATVTPGVRGIHLERSGGDAPSVPDEFEFTTTFVDHDGDGGSEEPTPEREVVADGNGVPIKSGGEFIFRTEEDAYKIGTTDYTGDELLEFLQASAEVPGGTVTGSLTVNNPGPNPGPGAPFNTTNADGIHVKSKGGKGSNGSCTTILVATWCDSGDRGGDAGSVAVNSDSKITAIGADTAYGVSAVSEGGAGGKGGGAFGLFASDAGGGGDGGDGANVTVILGASSDIATHGAGGHGVFANSTGGNGGAGGAPDGLVALGKDGGNGGDAGEVAVTNNGLIITHGEKAYGVYARSIGAGAGSGGGAGGLVAIGGNGGGQTAGNKVTVTNTGSIETKNIRSIGIFAQSVGGGGGDGGGAGGLISVGGKGGSGGNSDVVTVTNSGSVKTALEGSTAIFAQSVGGGGGNGGDAVAVGPGVSVAIGGGGGLGGNGKAVIVDLLDGSDIDTGAGASTGILAQSIGGGGGNGGFALSLAAPSSLPISASVAVGGSGGNGGRAGTVNVTSASSTDIDTNGDDSFGIVAQSIGGGGGNGGFAISGAASPNLSVTVGIGGSGGKGGDSDAVTVDNDGTITTDGQRAKGIFAQSIGGGGGSGGFSVAASLGAGAVSVGVGGGGGAAGNVGANKLVFVDNSGNILTRQSDSHGIHAQSVGGGGGSGGSTVSAALSGGVVAGSAAIGVGGDGGGGGSGQGVRVTNTGEIETKQDRSYGLAAQSIGGGGGDGGFAVAAAVSFSEKLNVAVGVPVGGTGGDAGTGSWVDVDNSNTILTAGELSHGILAQSVGGGGGAGGASIAATVSVGTGPSGALGVAIGGGGGDGGTAGRVDIANSGSISTQETGATGIRAQSIGGGGGTGGFAGGFGLTVGGNTSAAANITVGGGGGTGNYASLVDVDNEASITTGGDRAPGIYAESIGGGGGSGGGTANVSAAFSTSGSGMALGVGIGGAGGPGNDGAVVQVTSGGNITTGTVGGTSGFLSHGIHATSIGGGGGSGGFVASVAASGSSKAGGSVGVSVGGAGGDGGVGRNVGVGVRLNQTDIVANAPGLAYGDLIGVDPITGTITTHGTQAHGLYAESIGGGGGNGGFAGAFTGSFNTSDSKTLSLSVAVGGGGGDGGFAGDVYVDSAATVNINGNRSNGILARSVGGGGGSGGGAAAGAFGGKDSITINVAVGGAGGLGTEAGNVTVNNSGNITLNSGSGPAESEDENGAIVAQSIGGGGGNGGFAFSTSVGGPENRGINVSVGGNGGGVKIKDGDGNDKTTDGKDALSGKVVVTNTGVIVTDGGEAHGILGQSIGGSGGNGGFAAAIGVAVIPAEDTEWALNASVGVGGLGGDGNSGGRVEITNQNLITTHADNSQAIYAQSIGGGGGNGGVAFSGNVGLGNGDGKSFQAAVSIGGNGGDGDHGGDVEVVNDRALETFGDISHGILAQSIGGGGGAGGGANALNLLINRGNFDPFAEFSTSNLKLEIAVGGTGGSGQNDGGEVYVDNDGDIVTHGDQARGIWAQSIGGGGGNGGMGALSTGYAEGDLGAAIATCLPCNLPNIFDPTDLSVIVGGDGGANGEGKSVTVDNAAAITTSGSYSHGIYAQSIGGGGGEGILWFKDAEGGVGGKAAIGPNGKVGIGGAGGAAGRGGDVTVNMASTGSIETFGAESSGIFAQSIGGGGGVSGGIDRTLPFDPVGNALKARGLDDLSKIGNTGLGLGLTRSGGGDGNGGNLIVDSQGNITTHGSSSYGILTQTVGGAGGIAGGELGTGLSPFVGSVFAGSVGGDGDAGTIDVTQTGNITTSGYAAHGIYAQSAGGGDGANFGIGKRVDITLDGTIDTAGQNAMGILAQSVGADGRGNITVTIVAGSSVIGGTLVGLVTPDQLEAAAGIQLLDGASNLLTNNGIVTSKDGVDGLAVGATTGDDTIDNTGTVIGNISLGTGTNAFNNKQRATFNTGATGALGTGNLVTNDGALSPGGEDLILTTGLTGDLQQTGTGAYALDLDPETGGSDRIDVSDTSDLAGKVSVNVVNAGFARPGTHESTILTSANGVTDSGLGLVSEPSAVAGYALSFTSATEVTLTTGIDFSPSGLNRNQSSVGAYLNAVQSGGGSDSLAPIVAELYALPKVSDLAAVYDRLSPESVAAGQVAVIHSTQRFADALFSCQVRGGLQRFSNEGDCVWLDGRFRSFDSDSTGENLGFDETAWAISGGGQRRVGESSYLGGAISINDSSIDTEDLAHSDGRWFQLGLTAKRLFGATKLGIALSGGAGRYDSRRYVNFPGPVVAADSDEEMWFFSSRLRLSHDFASGNWFVRPLVDLAGTYVEFDGFTESGAGALNLRVDGRDDTYASVHPALEIGGEIARGDGTLVRPRAKVGVAYYFAGGDPEVAARFEGAPDGVQPFRVRGNLDDTYLTVDVGFDVLSRENVVMRAGYLGQLSDRTTSHGGAFKLSVPF